MRKSLAGVMVAALALAACRADSRFVLFSSDVFAVAEGGGSAPVSALYRVEISSLSDCTEQKAAIMEVVAKYLTPSSAAFCSGNDEDSWLEFSAKSDLVAQSAGIPGNAPIGLAAMTAGRAVEVHLLFDAARFGAMNRDVEHLELGASVELGALTIELLHDGDTPLVLSAPSAWVNNTPTVAPRVDLAHRDNVTIRVSDVALAALQADAQVLAFTLSPAP